jgi:hypothetical protein
MNKHDPLCGWGSDNHPECFPADICGNCEMIQRIRLDLLNIKQHEDEIEWEQGYRSGYEDAMKDCNMTFEDFKKRNEEWNEIIKAMNIKRIR